MRKSHSRHLPRGWCEYPLAHGFHGRSLCGGPPRTCMSSSQSGPTRCSYDAWKPKPTSYAASCRRRRTSNGSGWRWTGQHARSSPFTSGIEDSGECEAIVGKPASEIREQAIILHGSIRSLPRCDSPPRGTKPSQKRRAKPIISSVLIIRSANASRASCVRLSPSPRKSKITSGRSDTSSAITTARELQHYLYNTTLSKG